MASIFGPPTAHGPACGHQGSPPRNGKRSGIIRSLPREEKIGRILDHPGVMKVFSDGNHSRNYMVMEWVDGELLRKMLAGAE